MHLALLLVLSASCAPGAYGADGSADAGPSDRMGLLPAAWGAIVRPDATFDRLAASPSSVPVGWGATLAFAGMYSGTSLALYARGWEPLVPSPLPIRDEDYYLAQTLYCVPVGVAAMGIGSGASFGLSRAFGSDAAFGDLFGPMSVAGVVPWVFTAWLPETYIAATQRPGRVPWPTSVDTARVLVASVWATGLNVVAVHSAADLRWWQAVVVGVSASAVTGVVFGVFYR